MKREAGIVLCVLSAVLLMIVGAEISSCYLPLAMKAIPDALGKTVDLIVVALIGIIGSTRKEPPLPDSITTNSTTTAVTGEQP